MWTGGADQHLPFAQAVDHAGRQRAIRHLADRIGDKLDAEEKPAPRTSPMTGKRLASASRPCFNASPVRAAFSISRSSPITSRTAFAAAIETGLPPNVLK